ncbi:phage terminase large subunit [Thalassospira sp. MA62]|nr:phage terminase large subunit [Thalassospira sp. MA62]
MASFAEFVWIWDQMLGLGLPAHHRKMADWLEGRWRAGQRELLLMAFRNSGKSTLVGLFCAWLLYCNANLRILVLAADLDLAKKMVRTVKRVIERHPLMVSRIPERQSDWGSERFTVARDGVLRDPSMQAVGIGGNITGSRADIVICDDVEVPKNSDTAHKRSELREKLGEISYVLGPEGTQLYVGTPHSFYSIYADEARPDAGEDAPFLNGFSRFVLPIVDKDGAAAWPERFDRDAIAAMKARTPMRKFQSQMMLEMVAPTAGMLDPARLHFYDAPADIERANGALRLCVGDRRMVASACHFDPSYGGLKGDGAVIACVYICEAGEYWLHDVKWLRTSDPNTQTNTQTQTGDGAYDGACDGTNDRAGAWRDEASQLCAQVAAFLARHHLTSLRVETNGVGRFLPNILRRELKQIGWAASVVEHHETINKAQRIEDAFGAVMGAGLLHVHEDVRKTPFIRQMREWQPNGGGQDDGLDAVAGCILNDPVRLPRTDMPIRREDWRNFGSDQGFCAENRFNP